MLSRILITYCLGAAFAAFPAAAQGEDALPSKPASHTERHLEGWTVHVDDRLLHGDEAALGQKALRLLESRLFEVKLVVPAEKVERLQKVAFWLDQTCGSREAPQLVADPRVWKMMQKGSES